MTFFHGPLEHIKSRIDNRQEYVEYIKQIGNEFKLLAKSFNTQFTPIFDPLPFTELPNV